MNLALFVEVHLPIFLIFFNCFRSGSFAVFNTVYFCNNDFKDLTDPFAHRRHEPSDCIVWLNWVLKSLSIRKEVIFLVGFSKGQYFGLGTGTSKEDCTRIFVIAVVGGREYCYARWIIFFSVPFMQLIASILLLMRPDQAYIV